VVVTLIECVQHILGCSCVVEGLYAYVGSEEAPQMSSWVDRNLPHMNAQGDANTDPKTLINRVMISVALAHWEDAVQRPNCLITIQAESMQDVRRYLAMTTYEVDDPIRVALISSDVNLEVLKHMDVCKKSANEFFVMMHVKSVVGHPEGMSGTHSAPKDPIKMYGSLELQRWFQIKQQGMSYVTVNVMHE